MRKAEDELRLAGAHMNKVRFLVAAIDTNWIRDYGPEVVMETWLTALSEERPTTAATT